MLDFFGEKVATPPEFAKIPSDAAEASVPPSR